MQPRRTFKGPVSLWAPYWQRETPSRFPWGRLKSASGKPCCLILSYDFLDLDVFWNTRLFYQNCGYKAGLDQEEALLHDTRLSDIGPVGDPPEVFRNGCIPNSEAGFTFTTMLASPIC